MGEREQLKGKGKGMLERLPPAPPPPQIQGECNITRPIDFTETLQRREFRSATEQNTLPNGTQIFMTRNEGTTQNVNVVNTHDAGARQAIDVVNNANQEMRSAAEVLNQRLLQQQAHIEQREGQIARTFAAQEEARQREKWTRCERNLQKFYGVFKKVRRHSIRTTPRPNIRSARKWTG